MHHHTLYPSSHHAPSTSPSNTSSPTRHHPSKWLQTRHHIKHYHINHQLCQTSFSENVITSNTSPHQLRTLNTSHQISIHQHIKHITTSTSHHHHIKHSLIKQVTIEHITSKTSSHRTHYRIKQVPRQPHQPRHHHTKHVITSNTSTRHHIERITASNRSSHHHIKHIITGRTSIRSNKHVTAFSRIFGVFQVICELSSQITLETLSGKFLHAFESDISTTNTSSAENAFIIRKFRV